MSMSGYYDLRDGHEYTDDELDAMYAEWLDEFDGPVSVAGLTFDASRIIRELDPIAYRVGMTDFIDAKLGTNLTDDAEEAERIAGDDDDR